MKKGPTLPITNRFEGRQIAQCIVRNKFNMSKVTMELYDLGDITYGTLGNGTLGHQLLREPAVMIELGVIMDRTQKSADTFLDKMWKWLNDDTEGKEFNERRMTAARILAKGYIREKGPGDTKDVKPLMIEGLSEGIGNLTGETPVTAEKDPKKVM